MTGMLQILTYLLAFYLVVKGVEVLMIALASNIPDKRRILALGTLTLIACGGAAYSFVNMQDQQAQSISQSAPNLTPPSGQ